MSRFPILTFHALDHEPAVYSLAPDIFRHGMRQLHTHGYKTIDLTQVVALLRSGSPFPTRTVAITFDDGYWSFYAEAFPVLQEYGMTATVFVAAGDARQVPSHDRLPTLEGRAMLGWSQIREMARAGFSFGAHSMTHRDLRTLSSPDVSREILGSKAALEDRLGEAVTSFAYPFGRFDERSRAIVQEHFTAGCSDALGFVEPSSDPWTLERLDTYYLRSKRRFDTFFEPWFPSYIRARNVPRRLKRWVRLGSRLLCILPILLQLSLLNATAQDWPQFRGPGGQGHSSETGLVNAFSETKNVVWKTPVPGLGWSSPVVTGGKVWLTAATGDRDVSLRLLAFDVETGRQAINVEVFRVRNPRDINPKNSWASPTPILEGDHVYVHFGADGTAALTIGGEILWKKQFPYESQHGAGGSPVLYGDLLIFSCDGSDTAFVVALDKQTGKIRWRTNRRSPYDQAYTTPLVIRVGDRDQLVSIGAYRAAAYDPLTGKEIWRVDYRDGFSNVPRPVFGHGLVFIATGFQQPSVIAVRSDGTGDVTKTHVAWTLSRGAPLTPSPLLVGDELYVVNDAGILTCVNAETGTVLWQQRLGGTYSASPVAADGRLYFQSEQGVVSVLAPGKEFRLLTRNTLDGAMLATLAVSGGSFFIRTDSHLYRIGEK